MSRISDFEIQNDVLKKYNGPGGEVIVPAGVKTIYGDAFFRCESLTSVVLPEGLTEIQWRAFCNCTRLRHIVVPETLLSIGSNAFANTAFINDAQNWESGLLYLGKVLLFTDRAIQGKCTVRAGTRAIANSAFCGCGQLTHASLPEGLRRIGEEAFKDCAMLTEVSIPEGVEQIGDNAFMNCTGLARLTIPKTVMSIGVNAFYGCSSLEEIVLPDGLTNISGCMFSGCKKLASVTIPRGVTDIGSLAFCACQSLTDITLPDTLENIGGHVFSRCSGLKELWLPKGLKTVPVSVLGDRILPIHVEDISVLPPKLRPLAVLGLAKEGDCDASSARSKAHFKYIKQRAAKPDFMALVFEHPNLLSLMTREKLISATQIDLYLDEAQKRNCVEETAILMNYQVNALGMQIVLAAREKKQRKKEQDFEQILNRAEQRTDKDGIEGLVFVITGSLAHWSSRSDLKAFLKQCGATLASTVSKDVDYLITNDTQSGSEKNQKAQALGIEVINEDTFSRLIGMSTTFDDLPVVEVPESVRVLADKAFAKHGAVRKIVLPESLKFIGESAFEGCKALEEINIPDGVVTLGKNAFKGCGKLKKIRLSKDLKHLGERAFEGCKAIREIELPQGIDRIGMNTFKDCKSLRSVLLHEGLESIGFHAFMNCKALAAIRIPKGVKTLESEAFSGCEALASIELPEGLTRIEYMAFFACWSLESIALPMGMETVDTGVFIECGLNALRLSATLKRIVGNLGGELRELERIDVDVDSESFRTDDGVLFNANMTELICMPAKLKKASYTVPNSVSRIRGAAFSECKQLHSIALPDSVAELGNNAFAYCSNLKQISLGNGITQINQNTFRMCTSLESIVIPESVRQIDRGAFSDCKQLNSITVHENIEAVHAEAFQNTPALEDIVVIGAWPEGLTETLTHYPDKRWHIHTERPETVPEALRAWL